MGEAQLSSIEYLLPTPSRYVEKNSTKFENHRNTTDAVYLYPDALPLLHSSSTAVLRTMRSLVGLKKTSHCSSKNHLDKKLFRSSMSSSCQDIEYLRAIEQLLTHYISSKSLQSPLSIRLLRDVLAFYGLFIDDSKYRQWEQILGKQDQYLTLDLFSQACRYWFPTKQILHVQRTKIETSPLSNIEKLKKEEVVSDHKMSINDTSYDEVLDATHKFRREKKRLQQRSHSQSSLNPETAHHRLYHEKLACQILQRCAVHRLASANQKQHKTLLDFRLQREALHQQKVQDKEIHKRSSSFAANISMISRQLHKEESRANKDILIQENEEHVNELKQQMAKRHEHYLDIANERKSHAQREIMTMKSIHQEEIQLLRQYLLHRQVLLAQQHHHFHMSKSSSTLFEMPPEILAAKATAKTVKQKQKLHIMQREYFDHVASLQLLDYVYDKQCQLQHTQQPKTMTSVVNVSLSSTSSEMELKNALDDLWRDFCREIVHANDQIDSQMASGELKHLNCYIPPTNCPPAALRYYGRIRESQYIPFNSSVTRKLDKKI